MEKIETFDENVMCVCVCAGTPALSVRIAANRNLRRLVLLAGKVVAVGKCCFE